MRNINTTCLDRNTGLPYIDEFKIYCDSLIRTELEYPVLVSLDISNFKYFNQMYGFEQGDILIHECSKAFCLEYKDCVLASRIYVDHFIMLMDGHGYSEEELKTQYDKINRSFSEKINKSYPLARIHIYSGAYVITNREEHIGTIIDKAQYARRSIKGNYSSTIAFYSEEMKEKTQNDASIIPTFFSALEYDRIMVYLQPKFSIDTQKLIGAEALSRILDAKGNVISPACYIDILEKSGLISKLDEYVNKKVIALQKRWMEEGKKLTTISLNLSRMDFTEPDFIKKIDKRIKKSGVPPQYFEFELTETIFCENLEFIIKQVQWMRDKGYRISMDDFGTGYNSLYVLGKVPIDIIKFDRGFVLNSLGGNSGLTIMKNLVNTFKDVKFEVICEGVENEEEERLIYQCGCNAVQGFLHDKPLPYSEFEIKYMNESEESE